MLGQRHRFHGRASLARVYQRGKNVRGQLIGLKYSQRPGGRPYRVAVVVSRKVNKSAVARNRIRRRVYEQVRLNDELIKPGCDLIFTAYSPKLADLDSQKLRATLTNLLSKVA